MSVDCRDVGKVIDLSSFLFVSDGNCSCHEGLSRVVLGCEGVEICRVGVCKWGGEEEGMVRGGRTGWDGMLRIGDADEEEGNSEI